MCTVLLPPGGYPTAVNKYIRYSIFFVTKSSERFFSSTLQLVLPGVYAAPSTQKWWSWLHKTAADAYQSTEDQITEEQVCGRIKQSI